MWSNLPLQAVPASALPGCQRIPRQDMELPVIALRADHTADVMLLLARTFIPKALSLLEGLNGDPGIVSFLRDQRSNASAAEALWT